MNKLTCMVYLAFFIALILVFPLVFSGYFYLDINNKKLFLAVYLFKYVKLLSGFITFRDNGGFYFHISDKKVVILNKELFDKFKGGPDFLPKITVFNSYSIIDSGVKNDIWLSFLFTFYTILRNFNCILSNEINYLSLKTDLNVINIDKNLISVKLSLIFSFNLLGILNNFFGSLLLRGISYVKKQTEER